MIVLYPNLCYNEVCYKGAALQLSSGAIRLQFLLSLDSLQYFVYASSKGSAKTAHCSKLTHVSAPHICDKNQRLMSWLICSVSVDCVYLGK